MGRWANATESSSCQPRSRVTLVLGQSNSYTPERDLSAMQSAVSGFGF